MDNCHRTLTEKARSIGFDGFVFFFFFAAAVVVVLCCSYANYLCQLL